MVPVAPKPDFTNEALTIRQLIEITGLSKNTLYDLAKTGKIPGVSKWGRSYRIHGPTVLAWVQSGQALSRPRRAR